MADLNPHPTPDFETKIRAYLAFSILGSIVIMLAYSLYVYGHILAVLTLILGWLTGTANVLLSPYFGSPTASKKPNNSVTATGDQTTVNVTPTTDVPPPTPPTA